MTTIGIIGADFLVEKNKLIFIELGIDAFELTNLKQLDEIDGLLVTAWQERHIDQKGRFMRKILQRMPENQISIMGLAAGARALGKDSSMGVMDFISYMRPEKQITSAMLEVPSFDHTKFSAVYLPDRKSVV